ncbi:MAG: FAD-dependent oxidoreductase [Planctomycetota bacterium]
MNYDLGVAGGGLAGVCAAIAAARLGCKTALVQDRPVLGGNSSSEMRVTPTGANFSGLKRDLRETGILEELKLESWHRDPLRSFWVWDTILWELTTAEPNLTVYLNTSARKVVRQDNKIKSVVAEQLASEKTISFEADIFIDATGDGTIGYLAGAPYRMGREAKSEHQESLAPEKADYKMLPSALLFTARDLGHPVEFKPPHWARDFHSDDDIPFRNHEHIENGYWWIAWGGQTDTISDNEEIRDELLKILFGVWDHIKNHGPHGAENYALDWIGSLPAKRESRRLIGDYILTQQDIEAAHLFPDRIAYGGWPIDLHPAEGIYCRQGPFEVQHKLLRQPYSIPYRCLYSKDIENLLFAGRNISCTHVALGSTRVMGTCAVEGQAVGTAAYLCKEYSCLPRDIYRLHLGKLQQQLLKDDCYIPYVRNTDANDIARLARVTASSTRALEVTQVDGTHALDVPRAQMFPLTGNRIDKISLLLESHLNNTAEITVQLYKADSLWDFAEEKLVSSFSAKVCAGRQWVDFSFSLNIEPGLYWISLPASEGFDWYFSESELPGLQSAKWSHSRKMWVAQRRDYCFRLIPDSFPFGAENVINGVARPERWPNIWISEPGKGLPQALDLEFPKEITFDTVYLTFDTNLSQHIPFEYLESKKTQLQKQQADTIGWLLNPPAIAACVKDYSLYYWKANTWKNFLEVEGNYQRRRIHTFAPVSSNRFRLEIEATNGEKTARIYEIRVYNQKRKA